MVLFIVASTVGTHVWVEDITSGVATIAKIAESVDGKVSVASTFDAAPDFGSIGLMILRKVDSTSGVGLLVWVVQDALSVDRGVLPAVCVSARLELVAVVGEKGLALAIEVVDTVSGWFLPSVCVALGLVTTVGTVEGAAIPIVLATTILRSAVMGQTEGTKCEVRIGLMLVVVVALLGSIAV